MIVLNGAHLRLHSCLITPATLTYQQENDGWIIVKFGSYIDIFLRVSCNNSSISVLT